ncbi:MAG TPA: RT0821/Lpp0805 family surface protein [Burkholderiales bacterium]
MVKLVCMAAIVSLSLPALATAANIFSARDLPVRYMTDEDREILKSAVAEVLARNKDGETARWENPKTGAHGDLTPRATFQRAGQPCRELEVANSAKGRDNRVVLTLCKQAEGDWKIEPQ